MSGRTVIDVSEVIERQKPGRFLVVLVVVSWIITLTATTPTSSPMQHHIWRRSIISIG